MSALDQMKEVWPLAVGLFFGGFMVSLGWHFAAITLGLNKRVTTINVPLPEQPWREERR